MFQTNRESLKEKFPGRLNQTEKGVTFIHSKRGMTNALVGDGIAEMKVYFLCSKNVFFRLIFLVVYSKGFFSRIKLCRFSM